MHAHLCFPFVLAMVLPIHTHGSYAMFQKLDTDSNGHGSQRSEREQNGMRGPVRSVEEESTDPARMLGDGSQIAEMKTWSKTEYDRDGRVLAIRTRESSRGSGYNGVEWVTHRFYSPAGLLLKVTSGKEGEPACETVSHYDGQGRLRAPPIPSAQIIPSCSAMTLTAGRRESQSFRLLTIRRELPLYP
jgi:hypothetical protein